MLSIDTNLPFHAFAADRTEHAAAKSWMDPLHARTDVLLSELMLVEFYRQLRNPAVVRRPMSASAAAEIIQVYRSYPYWRVVGFPHEDAVVHDQLWSVCAQ